MFSSMPHKHSIMWNLIPQQRYTYLQHYTRVTVTNKIIYAGVGRRRCNNIKAKRNKRKLSEEIFVIVVNERGPW